MDDRRKFKNSNPGSNPYAPEYWEECTAQEWDRASQREILLLKGGGAVFVRAAA